MTQLEDDRERAAIRRDYAASLMSDTKWRKLIEALSHRDIYPPFCIVKFVGASEEREMRSPRANDIRTPSYLDTEFGPVPFRSIEWLEFPRSHLRRRYDGDGGVEEAQDVEAVRRAIDALGLYPLEDTGRSLRVIGHVVRTS